MRVRAVPLEGSCRPVQEGALCIDCGCIAYLCMQAMAPEAMHKHMRQHGLLVLVECMHASASVAVNMVNVYTQAPLLAHGHEQHLSVLVLLHHGLGCGCALQAQQQHTQLLGWCCWWPYIACMYGLLGLATFTAPQPVCICVCVVAPLQALSADRAAGAADAWAAAPGWL